MILDKKFLHLKINYCEMILRADERGFLPFKADCCEMVHRADIEGFLHKINNSTIVNSQFNSILHISPICLKCLITCLERNKYKISCKEK